MNKQKIRPEDVEAGKRLKTIRKAKGLSMEKLGSYLDVSFQQIQKYENGSNRIYGLTLYKISQFFELPMEFFFDHVERNQDNQLSVRAIINSKPEEYECIEESFNRQIDRHVDWACDSTEIAIKSKYDQPTANAHYLEIKKISTKRIIRMSRKIIKRLEKAANDG